MPCLRRLHVSLLQHRSELDPIAVHTISAAGKVAPRQVFLECFGFAAMLHIHLHFNITLTRRKNGQSLGNLEQSISESTGQGSALTFSDAQHEVSPQVPWASLEPQLEYVQVANDLISIRPTWMAEFECIIICISTHTSNFHVEIFIIH